MPSVSKVCDSCQIYVTAEIREAAAITCPQCGKPWAKVEEKSVFQSCPFCQCRQFYVQKDFNQAVGCAVMLVGIVLVPVTYGLSLPLFAFFDWLLFRQVPTIVVCYRCGAEFRGLTAPPHLKPFLHHIGEKYERETEKKSES